ncbi:MAG: DnaJ domain-containing protein [Clostridia bacterium]|nr:DnaJ domain-containing protein [Clostridia bacterium]
MNNPYEVLGVERDATEKDIMDAYRRIAGEINGSTIPDFERTRRMDELNNAYDIILNDLRGTSSYAQNTSSSSQQNYNYSNNYSQFSDVRQQINSGRLEDAEMILDGIHPSVRNAEWHYLKGVIHQRRGWLNEAYRHYQTACSMDPQNREYAAAFNSINNNANGGYRTTRRQSNSNGCDSCDICSGLLCADCCCECCGGDLIPCC